MNFDSPPDCMRDATYEARRRATLRRLREAAKAARLAAKRRKAKVAE